MSDPVSSMEIEDILSSIRTLVSSETARSRGKPPVKAAESADPLGAEAVSVREAIRTVQQQSDAPAANVDNRLVLTSDLRVADPERDTPAAERPLRLDRGDLRRAGTDAPGPLNLGNDMEIVTEPRVEPAPPVATSEPAPADSPVRIFSDKKRIVSDQVMTLEQRIAELEAAVTAQAFEFEPDGSEDGAQHRPTSVLRLGEDDLPVSSLGDDLDVRRRGEDVSRRIGQMREDAARLAEAMEGAAPLAGAPREDDVMRLDEPLTATSPLETEDLAEPEDQEDHEETGLFDDADAGNSAGQDDDRDAQDHPADLMEDGEILDAESPRFNSFHSRARAAAEEKDAPAMGFDDPDEEFLDEEALRDMVAEIVRQELQGALGERITRNVRKLVRREIMRAISIRDFE